MQWVEEQELVELADVVLLTRMIQMTVTMDRCTPEQVEEGLR